MPTVSEPTMARVPAAKVAYVHVRGPYSLFPGKLEELLQWMHEQRLGATGPAGALYYNSPTETSPDQLEWEAFFPVSAQAPTKTADSRGHGVKELPERRIVRALHKGPYNQVGETYTRLLEWVTRNEHTVQGPTEEVYLSDPSRTRPEDLLTEVRLPVS
ncbi:MAG: GyrI-like domain-containing protein [Chloroflexi bacterium]|nr:GyrI-like domain-containing protein [Chloroflexota bacterium]